MILREYYLTQITKGLENNPIVILIGARQVGKTTLMEMFVQGKKHLWLNGQNPEIARLFENFSTIERYLQVNMNPKIEGLLIIDEFQFINKISLYLKLLVDKYRKLQIICSGSSSLGVLQKLEESLAGRVRIINVYSLGFQEFIKFQNTELWHKFSNTNYKDDFHLLIPQIRQLFEEYILYGGLPKVALEFNYNEKVELLNDIYQTYLMRDVKQFIRNEDFVSMNKLLKILSSQIGSMLNINELSNTVQLSYRKCEEFIDILEQMFIIHKVSPYTTNVRKGITKMKKLFFCDCGLRNIVYNSFNDINIRTDNGQLFENYVYLQLLRNQKPRNILYYRTKDNTEIDFILSMPNGAIIPIEVKFKNYNKHKKIRAISEFQKQNDIRNSYIINKNLVQKKDNQCYIQPYNLTGLSWIK